MLDHIGLLHEQAMIGNDQVCSTFVVRWVLVVEVVSCRLPCRIRILVLTANVLLP